MKKDIHPKIYMEAPVACVCGNSFVTISTIPAIQVEVCSNCHPFFTGQQKFMDTEGRIDKFVKKATQMATKKQQLDDTKKARSAKAAVVKSQKTTEKKSMKEILEQLKKEEETAQSK